MNDSIFRQKSIDKVSSPDQLNDYIRVSNPSVWIVLAAILILLAGACVWSVWGHLDTTLGTVAIAQGGQLTCYVREDDAGRVTPGLTVRVAGTEAAILSIGSTPVSASAIGDAYALHLGSLSDSDWVSAASLGDTALADGSYEAQIVLESVSPLSFVLN